MRGSLAIALAATCSIVTLAQESDTVTQGSDTPPQIERPKTSFLRFNEDWSVLRDAPESAKTDFWDPFKFVPLNNDGSMWASFGGSARMRLEVWDGFGFGDTSAADDEYLLWRLLLHADVHFGDNIRVFVEGKNAMATDRDLPGGRRTLDIDELDLEQLFGDVSFDIGDEARLTVRGGRQALLFGKQRLVSPLGWSNTLRRWDAIGGILDCEGWKVHGFWSQFVPVEKYEFNDPDHDSEFYGAYATGKVPTTDIGLDLYFLGLEKSDDVTFNGTTGEEDRYTLGGRLFGKFGDSGFDYDFEGAWQGGDVGDGDVNAFMIGSELGYRFQDIDWSPRLFVGFDYASGDDDPGGDVETFNQLFPLGHAYLGYIDIVGRQNIIDVNFGATCNPIERLTAKVAGHLFWRAETSDALYNAGGGVVRAGGLSDEREVGQEIDFTLTYKFDRHLTGELGYSHFFAGDFIDESGPDDDINFFYVQLQYTF
jgi:hypothetical protein